MSIQDFFSKAGVKCSSWKTKSHTNSLSAFSSAICFLIETLEKSLISHHQLQVICQTVPFLLLLPINPSRSGSPRTASTNQFSATLQQQYGKDRRITVQMEEPGKKPVPQQQGKQKPSPNSHSLQLWGSFLPIRWIRIRRQEKEPSSVRTGSQRGCAQRAAAVRKFFCQGPHSSPGSSRASVERARYCWREEFKGSPSPLFLQDSKMNPDIFWAWNPGTNNKILCNTDCWDRAGIAKSFKAYSGLTEWITDCSSLH